MAIKDENLPIWEEIDCAENYLVCCMFDEAISLASSILKQLLQNYNHSDKGCNVPENFEWNDMMESAGMVLVQSMKNLQRTSEILKELKLLFGSITGIPVQVFLTGVCFQMSEGLSTTTVQGFLEEFVNSWVYVDDRYYPRSGADAGESDTEVSCFMNSLGVDEYLQLVELYVVTYLATTVKDTDLAISWVEKAMLPMESRQDLLRRLQSMSSSTVTSSSQTSISTHFPDEYNSDFCPDQKQYNRHQKDIASEYRPLERSYTVKEEILKLSRQKVSCLWWFPTINLKFGNIRLVVPSGKVLLASLLLIICYIMRKKQAMLKSIIAKKAVSVKKALVELWQFAFSYQVNPLAAVQPLPTTTHGAR